MSNESMPTGSQAFGSGPPSADFATPDATAQSVWDVKPPLLRVIFCWILAAATLTVGFVTPVELPLGGPETAGQARIWLVLLSLTVLFGSMLHVAFLPRFWATGLRIITAVCAIALASYHGYLCVSELRNRVNGEEVNFLPEDIGAWAFGLTIAFATLAIFPWREAWALVMVTAPIAMVAPTLDVLYPTASEPARIDVPGILSVLPMILLAPLLWLRASGRLPWLWFFVCLGATLGLFEMLSQFSIGLASNDTAHLAFLAFGSLFIICAVHIAWLIEDRARWKKAAAAVAPAPATAG